WYCTFVSRLSELLPRPPEGCRAVVAPFSLHRSRRSSPMPSEAMAEPLERHRAASVATTVRALFLVTGPAEPGLLPRLIEPIAKLGHVPSRIHATSESGDGSELSVDLRLCKVTPRTAQLVEHALRAMVGVRQVIAVVEPE